MIPSSSQDIMDVSLSSSNGFLVNTDTPSKAYDDAKPMTSNAIELPMLDGIFPLWVKVILACTIGLLLGQLKITNIIIENTTISDGTNVLVTVGLMLMMYPPLSKVRWTSVSSIISNYTLFALACFLNWVISPTCMCLLSWIFFNNSTRTGVVTGLSLVGCARSLVMASVWNDLAKGDTQFCAALAVANAVLAVCLYPPYAALCSSVLPRALGREAEADFPVQAHAQWSNVAVCVLTYVGVPMVAAVCICLIITRTRSEEYYLESFVPRVAQLSLGTLLLTMMAIFWVLSRNVLQQLPLGLIAAAASPVLLHALLMSLIAYRSSRALGASFAQASAVAFTAASNGVELALAAAGAAAVGDSYAPSMAAVAVLVEVPAMLALASVAPCVRAYYWSDEGTES